MVDKVTLVMADISLATIMYPLTKLVDAVWKPSQETLDHRLRFYMALLGDGAKNSMLFMKDALKKGANPDMILEGKEPLVVAAARMKLGKAVRLLGDSGANLNAKDRHGDTALVHSTYEGEISTVQYLLGKNVKIDAQIIEQHGPTAVATFTKAAPTFNLTAAIAQDNTAQATIAAPKVQPVTASM